jgi:hypothetical protein
MRYPLGLTQNTDLLAIAYAGKMASINRQYFMILCFAGASLAGIM